MRSDWAPMMLRVRPAQLTTTRLSGEAQPVRHAVHQLGAGAVERAGNAHIAEFADRPAVDDQDFLAGIETALQLGGGDMRRAASMLDQLAERLARHIDPGEQLEPRRRPGLAAARHHRDIVIAHALELRGGALGQMVVAAVEHDDPRPPARHQIADHQFEARQRHRIGEKRVPVLREHALLAHVEQRDLVAVAQHRPDFRRRQDPVCHFRHVFLSDPVLPRIALA